MENRGETKIVIVYDCGTKLSILKNGHVYSPAWIQGVKCGVDIKNNTGDVG